jgi:CheY-like chemotaxis protein
MMMGSVRRTGGQRQHVLVVDDDEDIREALADTLTLLGFRVSTAADGAQALAAMEASPEIPVAIVLDLMMPIMDGEEFGRTIRANPRFASIPIVVLSARNEADAIAAELHADSVLRKPVLLSDLRSAITHAVGARP